MNLQLVDSLVHIINTLTLEEKQILQTKILSILPKKPELTPLKEEPFIGIWSDRTDMENSTEWVKNIRQKEWR
ncbi:MULTISPECIES: hypothetical protein [Nostocales]|jgi:hypothetical protein|uniref:DUF2281 domain-containing protein n=2 Tax=Dolichospermum TaxID=748770 RepID=A0A1Z4V8M4_9CYAN|nr:MULTISPECIES: hypothetical protein [Nostocales]MBO1068322.1 hypothetical protein [Dolichospermum sp. DEX189]MCX5981980.1 hypothetical protein [Nostocales cyanobacterium LacPavin_0920_SED1_MAG_38_18]MDM3853916.1 hypothetical protein [Aphanizomenon gracile PMC649.10]MDM3862981.1 hypothetical protein [Aphanizomenon gracile PMC644.10]ALB41488.1 hypothetical protein AA650_14350 [Anabaena sp. WA102]